MSILALAFLWRKGKYHSFLAVYRCLRLLNRVQIHAWKLILKLRAEIKSEIYDELKKGVVVNFSIRESQNFGKNF